MRSSRRGLQPPITGPLNSRTRISSDSRAVLEWLELHQAELMEDWALAQVRKPLKPIAPLE